MEEFRIEKDGFGEIEIPINALYGAQTERALHNFPISGLKILRPFIRALGLIKSAAAKVNMDLGLLDPSIAKAIIDAADSVAEGHYDDQFPLDIFQTGSGTSTNMNANEVIANLAKLRSGKNIHPNDQVNMCQSSNDVIPTAIHLSACIELHESLFPALQHFCITLEKKIKEVGHIVTMGRTHLMDAMPITFGQELSGFLTQIRDGIARIESTVPRILQLAIGGTAVGTGINAHPEFGPRVCVLLEKKTGLAFKPQSNYFAGLASQDSIVELSGQIKVLSVSIMKISNDLRLMNSGPISGFAEISLPAIQQGSSIMPGKVNPVIPEAAVMVCAQIMGNDVTITIAGQSGSFQLNTMLPVIGYNILQNIKLMTNCSRILADKAIAGFLVNAENIQKELQYNPILVTALNPIIGYEKGALIAKRAYKEKRPIIEVAKEMTDLSEEELKRLLDPLSLTKGGIKGGT